MPKYTTFGKMALQHENVQNLVLFLLGVLLITYGSWMQNLNIVLSGIIVLIIDKIYVYKSAKKAKYKGKLSRFQKFLLGHTYMINFVMQLIGYLVVFYGAWIRSIGLILLGIILMLIGHVYAEFKERKVF